MFFRILQIFVFLLVLISCVATVEAPKKLEKKIQTEEINFNFTGITKLNLKDSDIIFNKEYVYALPDYRDYQEFNNYFQIGVYSAIKHFEIENKIEFISQDDLNLKNLGENFLIGPISKKIVEQIDGQLNINQALFLNPAEDNHYISLTDKPQINTLLKYLDANDADRIGVVYSSTKNETEGKFKKLWFDKDRDMITINASVDSNVRIENFLDISDSKERYKLIDDASFADVYFIPRSRDDFKQIIIFPENNNILYRLSSLIRFNYGLDYEIIALTSDLKDTLDPNEIKLHKIKLIDHTYLNRYSYDLSKSRSYSLGFDSMMIAYILSNKIDGTFKGFLGTYELQNETLEMRSYFN